MVNRSIQQKMLKMKRRNRHAVFSGATSKFMSERVVTVLDPVYKPDGSVDEDRMSMKEVRIPVGRVSLSAQVMSTGRGPNQERMQEYYQRLNSFDQSLPETLGLTGPMKELVENYRRIVNETPKENKVCLINEQAGRLDMFWTFDQVFFVDVDYKKKTLRRSKIYPNKQVALSLLKMEKITWVETAK